MRATRPAPEPRRHSPQRRRPPFFAVNVFFDVQGTLLAEDAPRPHVREVLSKLIAAGHGVYLWSSAGADYAASAAELLGVRDLVFGCYSKYSSPPMTVDFVVDDQPDFVARRGGYEISPFDGSPDDAEL